MWQSAPVLDEILAGDHQPTVEADAWYDGALTESDLVVSDATYTEALSGDMVRASMTLAVADDDGRLQPLDWTDPLASCGQQMQVAVTPRVGRWGEQVPLGRFRIEDPDASGSWRAVVKPNGTHWLPTGGTVTLPLVDLIAILSDSDLIGITGPPASGGTILSEFRRIAGPLVPLDVDGVDGVTAALPASTGLYGTSRVGVVADLARQAGGYLATTRTGAVTIRKPAPAVSLQVTRASGRWRGVKAVPSREGIVNAVRATGETPASSTVPIQRIAYETTGPTRYGGPLGILVEDISSAYWTTEAQAQAAADVRLAERIASRRRRFTVRATFDPRVQVLDLHRTDAPVGRKLVETDATVVAVTFDPRRGGLMEITYEAAL